MATAVRIGGYRTEQFESEVDEMFKCSICTDVLKDPVELACQHLYCKSCILQVLNQNAKCPQCRAEVTQMDSGHEEWTYYQPKRYFINMLWNLRLNCDLEGCQHISTIEAYENHQSGCQFNPNYRTECQRCRAVMPRVKLNDHDCVNYLLGKIKDNERALLNVTNVLETQPQEIEKQALKIGKQSQKIEQQAQKIEKLAQKIEQQAQKIEKLAQKIEKQAQEIAELKYQNKSRPPVVSGLQSLSMENTMIVGINCARHTNFAARTIFAKESGTIQNVCDQFSNELGDGDKFVCVMCVNTSCFLELNKTVKDNRITNGCFLVFYK